MDGPGARSRQAAVRRVSTSAATASVLPGLTTGPAGSWAHFAASTRSWDGVHGGTVIGTLVRAAAAATGAVPLTVTAALHRPVSTGPAMIEVGQPFGGRTAPGVAVELRQDEVAASGSVRLMADSAVSGPRAWPWRSPGARLLGQRPEQLEPLHLPAELVPFGQHVDIRPVGTARPLAGGRVPELSAWVRAVPATPFEPALAVVLLDALAPSLYAVRTDPVPIPTVEMTAHLLEHADVPDWLLVEQRTTWASTTLCLDDAALWTADGRLVAQARQVRRILTPRTAVAP